FVEELLRREGARIHSGPAGDGAGAGDGVSAPRDVVTFHDPCYLGRYAGKVDEPRDLLTRFGADIREPERNRDNPYCCGAGGGLLFADKEEEPGSRISDVRFKQLQATGANTVVTACPFCSIMLKGAQASAGADTQFVDLITSENFDGEWIAGIIERFGYGTARGSTSRGAVKALVQLKRDMAEGKPAAFTLDGPRGPAKVAQAGAIWLAKATGNPIIPFHIEADRYWTATSWDRTQIPKPWSNVAIAIGEPM